MKILTICQGGTVRSVCLARLLKDKDVAGRTHDALAASWQWNSAETLEMLGRWADMVVVMQPDMIERIPSIRRDQKLIVVCDVGPDRFGNAQNPELIAMCLKWIKSEGL